MKTRLLPGTILNQRYKIIQLLGQGGMGAIYLAKDMRLSVFCAIKENILDSMANPQILSQLRQQFQVEANILASLDHPNLPRVFDYFSNAGNDYLVMDYIHGENLESLLEKEGHPLSQKWVLRWANQILSALDYLHTRQPHPIIHRDIKPANIILTTQGKVQLVDFGLVKPLDNTKPSTTLVMKGMGTPEYTPLEQYPNTQGNTDARSDIYALGATLYHLLSGVAPPDALQRLTSPTGLLPLHHYNSALSTKVEQVILKAMALQPDERYQNAREMQQALAVVARPPPLMPMPMPPTQALLPSTPVSSQSHISVNTQSLDFGKVLFGKMRWQPLVIRSHNVNEQVEFLSSQAWITVYPTRIVFRRDESRTVAVRAQTSGLSTNSIHKGELILNSTTGQKRIVARVEVESAPEIGVIIAITLINMLAGSLFGLLTVGLLGNLVLWCLGHDLTTIPIVWGALGGGLTLVLVGFKIQDTLNLCLSLFAGVLAGALAGVILGMGLGLIISVLNGNQNMFFLMVALGLVIGQLVGAIYISIHPTLWLNDFYSKIKLK